MSARLSFLVVLLFASQALAVLRTKTIEVPFEQNTAAVAATTTYTSATRTIYIPETATRTFLNVTLRVYIRGNETAATSATVNNLGIQLAAVAFNDASVTVTQTNSGDQQSSVYTRDCTSYFTTNFGAGTSQTVAYRATITTLPTIAQTAKLYITYQYDDASATTRVKTVTIPLESNTAQLTATLASIGTNQIPLLNTFLPEASKVYRDIWFEMSANDAGNAVTDFQLGVRLDAEAEVLRANLEQALNSGVWYEDIWIRNDMDPAATHNFQARSTLASRFSLLTILLKVTYEYDHSASTSVMNSLVLSGGDDTSFPGNTATADESRFERRIIIEEPGPIALAQSGIVTVLEDPGTVTLNMQVGSQATSRAYVNTAGSVNSGPYSFSHRIDSGSGAGSAITLARGVQFLNVDWWSTVLAAGSDLSHTLYLNYTSGIAADGDGSHSHSVAYRLANTFNSNATVQRNLAAIQVVSIPETNWATTGFMYTADGWRPAAAASALNLQGEYGTGEGPEKGWADFFVSYVRTDGELGVVRSAGGVRDLFNRWNGDVDENRMTIETSRQYRFNSLTAANTDLTAWFSYYSITFTVSGTISGSAGGTVTLVLYRTSDNSPVLQTTRVGDGAYSFTWYDDVSDVYVVAYETNSLKGRSKTDVAGTGFDIALAAGGGGAESFF